MGISARQVKKTYFNFDVYSTAERHGSVRSLLGYVYFVHSRCTTEDGSATEALRVATLDSNPPKRASNGSFLLHLPAAERVELVDVAVKGGSRCHLIGRAFSVASTGKLAGFATDWRAGRRVFSSAHGASRG